MRGGGAAQGHPLRLDSGSALRLRAFSPSPDEPGREAGQGLGIGDACISLEPSSSPPAPYVDPVFPGFLFISLSLPAWERALHLEAEDGFPSVALPLLCESPRIAVSTTVFF